MDYKLKKLDNGLRVVFVPLPEVEAVTVTVWVGVGSRFEKDKVSGISHFLEHMVFKGSKKRPSAHEIAEAVDSIGGEFNASTSKEWTNFYIKTRAANLETAFDVLSDMVLNPLIKEEDLEREKGVIVEEIGMYEDTPLWKIGDVFENLIFKGNNLGRDIIGTRETVTSVTRDDFLDYRKTHYGSRNIVVTVSGGTNHKDIAKLTEKYFKGLTKKDQEKYQKFTKKQKSPRTLLYPKKKEQAHFIIGFYAGKRGGKDRFAESVLTSILGGGMSSRLFTEVREKRGLAYAVRASKERYMDTGHIQFYAGVDPQRIEEATKVIIDQVYGLRDGKYKIDKKELNKAKEYVKGHLALSLEDTKNVNRFFGVQELLLDKMITPEDVYEGVDKVSLDDVMRVANKILVPEGLNLAIIGPYDKEERFKKLIS